MKAWIQICSMTIFLFLLPMGTQAYTIYDNYIGPNDHGWGDVIGNPAYFDISRIEVNYVNGTMIVDIYSRYFDNIGIYGTQLGDLFIRSNGAGWDYAAVLDNHSAGGGQFGLYKISNGGGTILSHGSDGTTWRDGQIVQFVPAGTAVSSGAWSIYGLETSSDTDDYLRFTINYSAWGIKDIFGLRWTMTCGNDVIEGEDPPNPVPEPATMLLLGSGLLGLVGLRRKFKK